MSKEIVEQVKGYYQDSFDKASPELQSFFEDHVRGVVGHARELAEGQNVDLEIVEISAWLHDIATIQGKYEEHHVDGSRISEEFLKGLEYPQEKIDQVKDCILNHRGSKPGDVKTSEAQILIDADAMTHFDEIDLLLRTYYKTNESVLAKLERSYNKMSSEAKEIIRPKLEKAREELK